MQPQKPELKRFLEFKTRMLDSLTSQQKKNLINKQRLLEQIILIHTLNDYMGLVGLDQKDNQVQFDPKWAQNKQGVWKLRYFYVNKITNTNIKIFLFRFIEVNDQLSVNICIQDTVNLQSYVIYQADNHEAIEMKHMKALEYLMSTEKQQKKQWSPSFLRSVPLKPGQNERPSTRPGPILPPQNLPFDNPFGKQEYVGPHSHIFGDRPYNPGFQGPNPLGRYDPIDPFDKGQRKDPDDDFQGFDEFGIPIVKPNLPKGPGYTNPFQDRPPFWKK